MKVRKLYWNNKTNRWQKKKQDIEVVDKVQEYIEKQKKFERMIYTWVGSIVLLTVGLIIVGLVWLVNFLLK